MRSCVKHFWIKRLAIWLVLILVFNLTATPAVDAAKVKNKKASAKQTTSVIHVFTLGARPVADWLAMKGPEVRKILGKPRAGTGIDKNYLEGFAYDVFKAFGGCVFAYGGASNLKKDYNDYCNYIVVGPSAVTYKGTNLRKNYKALVKLLGNPSSQYYDEEGDDPNLAGPYLVDFIVQDKNGKKLNLRFSFENLKGALADGVYLYY